MERPIAEPARVPEESAAAGRSVPVAVEARVRDTAGVVGEGVPGTLRTKAASGKRGRVPAAPPGRAVTPVVRGLAGLGLPLSAHCPHLRRVGSPCGIGDVSTGWAWALPGDWRRGTGDGGQARSEGDVGRKSLIPASRAGPSSAGRAAM